MWIANGGTIHFTNYCCVKIADIFAIAICESYLISKKCPNHSLPFANLVKFESHKGRERDLVLFTVVHCLLA